MSFINSVLNYPLGGITVRMLLVAALILLIGCILARFLVRPLCRLVERTSWDISLKRVMMLIIRTVLYTVVVLIAADYLSIPITSMLTFLSIVGLAVSLSIQDILANMFSGMLLLASKTLSSGDYVLINTYEGTVTDVDLMNTHLLTPDHKTVRLPNKTVQNSPIVNFSRQDLRRVEFRMVLAVTNSSDTVIGALLQAAEQVDVLLRDPAPFAGVQSFQNKNIEYILQVWTSAENYQVAYYALSEAIRKAFVANNIE